MTLLRSFAVLALGGAVAVLTGCATLDDLPPPDMSHAPVVPAPKEAPRVAIRRMCAPCQAC
mgnify:CR=1 FL=1